MIFPKEPRNAQTRQGASKKLQSTTSASSSQVINSERSYDLIQTLPNSMMFSFIRRSRSLQNFVNLTPQHARLRSGPKDHFPGYLDIFFLPYVEEKRAREVWKCSAMKSLTDRAFLIEALPRINYSEEVKKHVEGGDFNGHFSYMICRHEVRIYYARLSKSKPFELDIMLVHILDMREWDDVERFLNTHKHIQQWGSYMYDSFEARTEHLRKT